MHLLSVIEILEAIKKIKAFINTLRVTGYHEKKKKNRFTKNICKYHK